MDKFSRSKNIIKGNFAETIIQRMFELSNYIVIKNGVQNRYPELYKKINNKNTVSNLILRYAPDFVVIDSEGYSTHVEVKWRESAKFSISDLPLDYPYNDVVFIVLSNGFVKSIHLDSLKNGNKIHPRCKNYIKTDNSFKLNNQAVLDAIEQTYLFSDSFIDEF